MTQQDLLLEAQRRVARRRQAAEAAAAERRADAYRQAPELMEIEGRRAAAGATAAMRAAEGHGEEAQVALEEARREMEIFQAALARHGWRPQDMEPAYHCAICRDTGRNKGAVCVCVQEELRRLRRRQVHDAGPLKLTRFENFSLEYYPETTEEGQGSPRRTMARVLQRCREYAQQFGPRSESLFLFGNAGLGKTHLAMAIAYEVLERGFDAIYVSAQSAFAEISRQRFERGSDLFDSMMDADLLVMDDLGTEYLDAYSYSRLYELVNGRQRRPTIYTTNICDSDQLYQRYTEKIASRLLGECSPIRFYGEDIRLLHK